MSFRSRLLPIILEVVRPGVTRALAELCACDGMSREQVERMQLRKLNVLLDHHVKSPLYRDVCGGTLNGTPLKSLVGLAGLPIITKDFLRRYFENGRPRNAARSLSTSGSSGKNLWFYQSREMLDASTAAHWYCAKLMGVDAWGDRQIGVWGQSPPNGFADRVSNRAKCLICNIALLQGYGLDEMMALDYLERVRREQPRLLYGYPSYLHLIAVSGRQHGVLPPKTEVVLCSGEQLQQHHRDEIESYFGTSLYNRYGCREFGVIAHETPEHNGLYVPPCRFFIENDKDGELLVTDLDNFATPFIRYAIGDMGEVRDAYDELGRAGQCIVNIEGRVHDVLRTPSGKMLPGQFWTLLSRKVPGIREFQVAQTAPDIIELRIVANSDYASQNEPLLLKHFKEIAGDEVDLRIRRIDAVERTEMGKRRFVIREGGKQRDA